jgi:hypothetical protein
MVMVFGEITTKTVLDYQKIVRDAVKDIGFDDGRKGFDYKTCNLLVAIEQQSPEIGGAVFGAGDAKKDEDLGAGELRSTRHCFGAGHGRGTDGDAIAVADEQDFIDFDVGTGFGIELFDAEHFVLHHAVLFTAGNDNCVHDLDSSVVILEKPGLWSKPRREIMRLSPRKVNRLRGYGDRIGVTAGPSLNRRSDYRPATAS